MDKTLAEIRADVTSLREHAAKYWKLAEQTLPHLAGP